ncbi:carbohydrate-binding protein, partial [Paenibacillus sp. LMG 31458]
GVANPNNVPLTTSISVTVQYVGKVEVENYVNMSGIQTEDSSEGTKDVGYTDPGDWMDYVVNVPETGVYKLNYRVAVNGGNTGKVNFLVDGVSQKITSLPSTGGWQNWSTVSDEVSLIAGSHTIRLRVEAGGWNINWFELVAPAAPVTPKSTLTGVQQVNSGQAFNLTMGLTDVTQSVYQQVYGQDFTLQYDPASVQFDSVTSLKEGFQVIDQKETAPGQLRIVAASVGTNVPAQGDLLAIQFTAKSVTQATNTTISVDHVVIANAEGNELQVGAASREIQITVPSVPVDKSLLNAAITSAQAMYDAAMEGNGDGLYVIGSKAQLQSAIDAAKAAVNDSNATQQQVDSAKAALEAAVQVFESKKITADINGGGISIGDLAVVAAAYGKQTGQAGWNEKADVNHDGTVDIVDLAIVAKAILK